MDKPTIHHPQGPSQLENLDPRSGGCRVFTPLQRAPGEMAEKGSRQHLAVATDDLSVLEGDREAEAEVLEAREFILSQEARFGPGEAFHEILLEVPYVNFGTADYLKL